MSIGRLHRILIGVLSGVGSFENEKCVLLMVVMGWKNNPPLNRSKGGRFRQDLQLCGGGDFSGLGKLGTCDLQERL